MREHTSGVFDVPPVDLLDPKHPDYQRNMYEATGAWRTFKQKHDSRPALSLSTILLGPPVFAFLYVGWQMLTGKDSSGFGGWMLVLIGAIFLLVIVYEQFAKKRRRLALLEKFEDEYPKYAPYVKDLGY